ncbi:hypothetical protein HDU96_008008 [Phlyctochytrium bullatum]|nr:hypothetical protein HDU96_008008 [Phlyctochytrium bullatum]
MRKLHSRTGTYVLTECQNAGVSVGYTTTTGRDGSIPFKFDAESENPEPFRALPAAKTVLITFPLKGELSARRFLTLYKETHEPRSSNFLLLGSTSAIQPEDPSTSPWCDENVKIDLKDPRVAAEQVVLADGGCILSLSGLYDYGRRFPGNFVGMLDDTLLRFSFCCKPLLISCSPERVVPSKEVLATKTSVHYIHGEDVARAILSVHHRFSPARRWVLTNLRVYDWWDLGSRLKPLGPIPAPTFKDPHAPEAIADTSATAPLKKQKTGEDEAETKRKLRAGWALELMQEQGVRGLPREPAALGRAVDSRAFWTYAGITPIHTRL